MAYNGTRLNDVFNLNNDTMTTEQNEMKSAEWRKKNLSKNSSLANVGGSVSYRQRFGLDNPPKDTVLNLKYMEGLKWYLCWAECPDCQNIVQGWFGTASEARKYANENGWLVSY
jgi:hypothetical protein